MKSRSRAHPSSPLFLSFSRSSFFFSCATFFLQHSLASFVVLLASSFSVPFHHFLFSCSSYLVLSSSSSSSSMRCFLFTDIYAALPSPCLCYHISSFLSDCSFSILVQGVSAGARRLIYESHASNPTAPRDMANDMCFSTLGVFYSFHLDRLSFSILSLHISVTLYFLVKSSFYLTDTVWKIECSAEY